MPPITAPEVHVKAVKYTVCALPESNRNHRFYALEVQHMGRDRWAVVRFDACLGADGTWADGVKPYGRGDDWLTAHRFDLDTALRLATEAAPHVVVNGYSAADVLADAEGEQA